MPSSYNDPSDYGDEGWMARRAASSGGGSSGSQWGYLDPNTIRENMLQGMPTEQFETLANQYGTRAGQQFGMQDQLFGQGMGLMQGDSPILEAMRQQQAQQLGDIGSSQMLQQNRALAARGMGGGGLSDILGTKTTSALGEQSQKGLLGIQQYGLQAGSAMTGQAQGFGQLGMSGLSGQGNALGSLGAMQSQANQAQNIQMQTNAANQASYMQAQAARARAKKAKRGGLFGGIVGGIGGFLLTGTPQGASMGYSLGSSIGSG